MKILHSSSLFSLCCLACLFLLSLHNKAAIPKISLYHKYHKEGKLKKSTAAVELLFSIFTLSRLQALFLCRDVTKELNVLTFKSLEWVHHISLSVLDRPSYLHNNNSLNSHITSWKSFKGPLWLLEQSDICITNESTRAFDTWMWKSVLTEAKKLLMVSSQPLKWALMNY